MSVAHFMSTAPPPTEIYTLSLHDALPISTTWGHPPWKDKIATGNAVLVDRLLAAGAVIYGKTNVPLMLQDAQSRSEEHTSELQSRRDLVCRLLLEKKKRSS